MSGRSTRTVPFEGGSQKVLSHPGRRVCAEGSCSTVLSRYNGSDLCWVHEPPGRRTGSVLRS